MNEKEGGLGRIPPLTPWQTRMKGGEGHNDGSH